VLLIYALFLHSINIYQAQFSPDTGSTIGNKIYSRPSGGSQFSKKDRVVSWRMASAYGFNFHVIPYAEFYHPGKLSSVELILVLC
jgi:hypothetical protein